MSKHANAYQIFLNLCHAIDELTGLPKLTPDEKFIIKIMNNYWVNNKPITVVQAMSAVGTQSTSTVFRNLKKIRQKGYIQLVVDDEDNRIKYIQPTEQVMKYFHEHGKLLIKTAKNFS